MQSIQVDLNGVNHFAVVAVVAVVVVAVVVVGPSPLPSPEGGNRRSCCINEWTSGTINWRPILNFTWKYFSGWKQFNNKNKNTKIPFFVVVDVAAVVVVAGNNSWQCDGRQLEVEKLATETTICNNSNRKWHHYDVQMTSQIRLQENDWNRLRIFKKNCPKWHRNDIKMTPKWHHNFNLAKMTEIDHEYLKQTVQNDIKMTLKWHQICNLTKMTKRD